MAKKKSIPREVIEKAIAFAELINKQGFPIAKLIIFGSYAKGTSDRYSDIDLCVISPKFGKDSIAELQFLLKQTRAIDDRIEPFPLSLQEYKKSISPLVFEIKKFGKEIAY